MRFTIVTILPELIEPSLSAGVVGRAREAGVITVDTVNPRDFTRDKHRTVDDTPYGGGPGMVMKAEPLLAAIAKASESVRTTAHTFPRPDTIPGHASADLDVLGQPRDPLDPLEQVESAIAKVESMLDGLGGATGPRTARQIEHESTSVTDAEATLAEIEQALHKEALEQALSPISDAETKPVAKIDEDIDLRLPSHTNVRRDSLGPAEPEGEHDEMPNLVEPRNIVATPPVGVPVVVPPSDATPSDASPGQSGASPADRPSDATPSGASPGQSGASPADRPSDATPSGASPGQSGANPADRPSDARPSDARPSDARPSEARPSEAKPPAAKRVHRILLSPSGKPLTQARVRELAKLDHLVLVCGRYEGVDQRVIDLAIDEELSIGDYVLSGGELGALVIVDAVARLIPGVLGEPTSADDESFSAGLLEYPQYTKPAEITMPASLQSDRVASPVPPVLTTGNHAAIASWRRQQSMQRTAARRPDLWRAFRPTKADAKLLPPLRARTHVALVHHPIVDRAGAIITTALTNFDIHDLARSTMTYGLAGYHIVTPITSQREKAEHIAKLWMEDEQGEHRASALRLVRTAESIEAVIAALTTEHGTAPLVVATSARADSFPTAPRRTSSDLLAEASLSPAPLLLLLGTGWGLADAKIPSVSRVLAPIEGASEWNHLSVRSAGAVILDRLFGRPA